MIARLLARAGYLAAPPDGALLRVSAPILELLERGRDLRSVVILGVNRKGDGMIDLTLAHPERTGLELRAAALAAAADAVLDSAGDARAVYPAGITGVRLAELTRLRAAAEAVR